MAVLPAIELAAVPVWLSVQFPVGRPEISTEPVAKAHVGAVIVPVVGAAGVTGCAGIGTFTERTEVQPTELVTVKL